MTDNLIGERYVLGPLLGRGGMADVRRARDTRLERDVAIKRLKVDLAGDPIFQERFRREAHAAAGLNHPNIVSVFDTGESYDEASGLMVPYIVMELVVGHTLREILRDGRKIQPIKALELTQAVLDALDYSHRHGIIHRDIKPANVMLTSTGQVKVMDFGIARAVSDTAASMTQTASVIGTPQYLSPEQIRGETVDRRSDVYSTGCLLYELLTGKPPFEGDSPVSLAYQHVRATPVPPSEVDPMVSTQMDAVVCKALAKSPADRYQTAHDMAEDIGRLLAGQRVQAVIPPPVEDTPTQVMTGGSGSGGTTSADKTQVMPQRGVPNPKQPARALAAEEEEEPSHLGRIIAIVVGVMLVIALIAAGLIWQLNKPQSEPSGLPATNAPTAMVAVPALFTMNQDAAVETLASRGLKAQIEPYEGAEDKTVGTVTKQNPVEGTMVPVGSTVKISINTGPHKYPVPNVVGKSTDDATAEMLKTFTNVTALPAPTEGPNDTPGTIISQDPPAGGTATKDQAITLYYATGEVTLPNLVGMDKSAAMDALAKLGFLPSKIVLVDDESTQPVGQITSMDPGPGNRVAKDSTITLGVAVPVPPPPTQTPTDNTTPSETATPHG